MPVWRVEVGSKPLDVRGDLTSTQCPGASGDQALSTAIDRFFMGTSYGFNQTALQWWTMSTIKVARKVWQWRIGDLQIPSVGRSSHAGSLAVYIPGVKARADTYLSCLPQDWGEGSLYPGVFRQLGLQWDTPGVPSHQERYQGCGGSEGSFD